jgi:hypothetical protein
MSAATRTSYREKLLASDLSVFVEDFIAATLFEYPNETIG